MDESNYPSFVVSAEDKAAYATAVIHGFDKWVHNASDILAIKNGCWFDLDAAQRVEKFFLLLRHSKGKFAGKPFVLDEWQRDKIIYPLFGWKRSDGTRRFRKGMAIVPKKNGKSTIAAALALYLSVADGEAGAEVYTAAADRSNSMNVMGEAMAMVRSSPVLKKWLASRNLIIYEGTKRIQYGNSFFQALSSEAASAEGKNIHGLIFDELHTQASRDLWRALQGGGIAREQPLFLAITTAGRDINSLCYSEYQYAKRVLSGEEEDWTYFAFIAEADPNDDPGDPETWKKANPGLGVSPSLQALRDLWMKAKGNPEDENDFKQYHLNIWVQRATSAIPLTVWDVGGEPFDSDELLGMECVGGLDLGAVSDLTALALLFKMPDGSYKVLLYVWCPEDRSADRGQKRISYLKWMEEGWITPTPGRAIDYELLRADIGRIAAKHKLKHLGVDMKFQGKQLAQQLISDGLPVIDYGNNVGNMASPSRTFMELVFGGKLHHGGNPVLRWMAGNLVMKRDTQNNMMPDKAKSHEKIDGISGIIMALGVATLLPETKESHFETHELEFIEL